MQVLFEEGEFRRIQAAARARGLSVAEWVRQHLREAARSTPIGSAPKKLDVVRTAAQHSFPSGDIDQMLEEIERGYGRAE
jgi:hypothetical protein